MQITPEMISALAALRGFARKEAGWAARQAVNTLDNAGVFAAIDEAAGYDIDGTGDRTPNGLDSAEWGDMAFGKRNG